MTDESRRLPRGQNQRSVVFAAAHEWVAPEFDRKREADAVSAVAEPEPAKPATMAEFVEALTPEQFDALSVEMDRAVGIDGVEE